ncbi:hypothetical protein EGW08_018530 [Elysia chlorotica]|uniref:Uncharacterized protein n=1 Tax=Elysia chlorotica TaxID=188477 RepID=A0A433SWN2_ELYCH|nr:hypothetical protein EGW08_018530 [Elysia chlorotica]
MKEKLFRTINQNKTEHTFCHMCEILYILFLNYIKYVQETQPSTKRNLSRTDCPCVCVYVCVCVCVCVCRPMRGPVSNESQKKRTKCGLLVGKHHKALQHDSPRNGLGFSCYDYLFLQLRVIITHWQNTSCFSCYDYLLLPLRAIV